LKYLLRAFDIYENENQALKIDNTCGEELQSLNEDKYTIFNFIKILADKLHLENNYSEEVVIEMVKEKILFPKHKISIMIMTFVLMVMISLLKGSGHTPSIIHIER
jgi:hypothetical protein